jgi:outer membrane protein assembly factor BamB
MIRKFGSLLFAGACVLFVGGADWPQFRGKDSAGFADDHPLPTTWGPKENIAWKVDLPGRGLAAPIVVGDRVIVTCGSGFRQDRLHVLCLDAATGAKRWERQFWSTGRTFCHPKTCMASSTPASNGELIFALYSTNDLVCLDLEGNVRWLRGLTSDYPNASNSLGMASSPIVVDNTLVVQLENDSSQSFACGLDIATGENRWKIDRPSLANWTSPVVIRGREKGEDVVLLQSGRQLSAHDPRTGKQRWVWEKGCSTIPSSAVADNTIVVPSDGLTALRPDPDHKVAQVLWNSRRLAPATGTPLLYQGRVYVLNGAGVLNCADLKTGNLEWQLRLKGPFTSSLVAAAGHVYAFNEEGLGQVVKTGAKGELVGTGELGEVILCTPAIANGALYVRSDGHLWKIAQNKDPKAGGN